MRRAVSRYSVMGWPFNEKSFVMSSGHWLLCRKNGFWEHAKNEKKKDQRYHQENSTYQSWNIHPITPRKKISRLLVPAGTEARVAARIATRSAVTKRTRICVRISFRCLTVKKNFKFPPALQFSVLVETKISRTSPAYKVSSVSLQQVSGVSGRRDGGEGDRGVRLSTAAIYEPTGGIKSTLASSRVLRDHWCYWGSGGRSSRSGFLWRRRGEGGGYRGSYEKGGKRERVNWRDKLADTCRHTLKEKKKDAIRQTHGKTQTKKGT